MTCLATLGARVRPLVGVLLCIVALDTCRGASTACAMTPGCFVGEPACPGDTVAVTVAVTGVAAFAWSPGCWMTWLEVVDSSAVTMWRVIDTHNQLVSSVSYGQLPARAVQSAPATGLVSGATYRVTVRRSHPDQVPLSLYGGGTTTFIAP